MLNLHRSVLLFSVYSYLYLCKKKVSYEKDTEVFTRRNNPHFLLQRNCKLAPDEGQEDKPSESWERVRKFFFTPHCVETEFSCLQFVSIHYISLLFKIFLFHLCLFF